MMQRNTRIPGEVIERIFSQLTIELVNALKRFSYQVDIADVTNRAPAIASQAHYVLSLYYAARSRRLEPKRRRVHMSSILKQKLESGVIIPAEQTALQKIATISSSGGDLFPYFSTSVALLETRFQNQDKLYNDWNIIHLHLGIGEPARDSRFADRSTNLIFAYPTGDSLYFVDLRPHGQEAWLDKELLEIIHREWPSILDHARVPNAKNASIKARPEIVKALRGKTSKQEKAAMKIGAPYTFSTSYPIEVSDGTIYLQPGGGLMSNGMRNTVVRNANNAMRILADWVVNNPEEKISKDVFMISKKRIATPRVGLGIISNNLWHTRLEIFEEISAVLLGNMTL